MKKFVYILVAGFLSLSSCSTHKDAFLNRTYHNMTSTFNVLYNGNIALEKGKKELADKYQDNFWELIPIEPLHIDEEKPLVIPGEGDNTDKPKSAFDLAEEKAVKAIQKHSMFVEGKELNKQTDAAYLLLGKARYYSQRFVPALEAFDYLLRNFHNDDLSNDLRIWKAKTQIRLQNEERAIQTLRHLISYKDIQDETKENAHTALAMAYVANDSFHLAIKQLNKATETHFNKNQYARNLLVLSQLYRKKNNKDSSMIVLKKILAFKKSPFKYKMQAYIEQAKSISDSTDYSVLQNQYAKLIKVYENKEYLDALYYQLALMDFRDGNDSLALKNLTNSTHAKMAKSYQMGLSYEKAGNYFFDKSQFVKAGAFYDSVLATAKNNNSKRFRKLKRKRKSLEEVIEFETLLKTNDSLFRFIAMNPSERRSYFEKYVADLEKKDKIAAIQKENQERANSSGIGGSIGAKGNSNTGKWYFYNAQTIGFGKSGFQRIWGNRALKDNWRLFEGDTDLSATDALDDSNQRNSKKGTTMSGMSDADQSKKYDVEYYLSLIPSDEKVIQQMHEDTSNALYQLGLNYKEKFKVYDLAALRLERFLKEKPKNKFILPAKYHLYKIYQITGNPKQTTLKNEIVSEFPNSRFTEMIQNPETTANTRKKKETDLHYEKVYCDYEFENYKSVLDQCNVAIKKYTDDPIQRKFELLKSYAIYKLEGKQPFMTNLKYVTENFPKTEEADHAQDVLDFLNGVKKTANKKTEKNIILPNGMNKRGRENGSFTNPISNGKKGMGSNKSPSKTKKSSSRKTNNRGVGPKGSNPFNGGSGSHMKNKKPKNTNNSSLGG